MCGAETRLVDVKRLDAALQALFPNPTVRQKAAMHLGTADTSSVMPALVEAMASERDDFVRETLVWAVVARPETATKQLVAALERDDLPHEPVLHALSKIGDAATG